MEKLTIGTKFLSLFFPNFVHDILFLKMLYDNNLSYLDVCKICI